MSWDCGFHPFYMPHFCGVTKPHSCGLLIVRGQLNVLRHYVKAALIAVVAGTMYFALAYFTVGSFFGWAPGFEWSQETFGPLAGTRVWSHSVHAAAVLVAAMPSALVLGILGGPHALRLAALTGVLVAAALFVPSLLHPEVRLYLDAADYVIAGIDSLKMVLILMLLTWLVGKLPSDNVFEPSDYSGRGR